MVDVEDWIESNPESEIVNSDDGEEVILYVEEKEHYMIEHRISRSEFTQIFGPVIREASSVDDLTAEDFLSALNSPSEIDESDTGGDLGYQHVIKHWRDSSVFS